MALTERELFKRAFVKRCADEGLTEDQILDRIASYMDKRANPVSNVVNWFSTGLQNANKPNAKGERGTSPIPAAMLMGVGAPFLAGAGTGALASKVKGNWYDEQDEKSEQLLSELKRQTELAKQFHRMGGTSPSSF